MWTALHSVFVQSLTACGRWLKPILPLTAMVTKTIKQLILHKTHCCRI